MSRGQKPLEQKEYGSLPITRKATIMTQREFLNAVFNAHISNEMDEYATSAIQKIDKRNATPTKAEKAKKEENRNLQNQILQILRNAEAPLTAAEIAIELEISDAKSRAMLSQMFKREEIVRTETKIPKKGKTNVYSVAQT